MEITGNKNDNRDPIISKGPIFMPIEEELGLYPVFILSILPFVFISNLSLPIIVKKVIVQYFGKKIVTIVLIKIEK